MTPHANQRHGHSTRVSGPTGEYRCWSSMITRCTNPKHKAFARYGGAGVKVCARWLGDFAAFLADVGPRPSLEHSLDRYPNRAGDYEPGNVRWATRSEQATNRATTRFVEHNGETKSMRAWALATGIGEDTLRARLKAGWSVADALSPGDGRVACHHRKA